MPSISPLDLHTSQDPPQIVVGNGGMPGPSWFARLLAKIHQLLASGWQGAVTLGVSIVAVVTIGMGGVFAFSYLHQTEGNDAVATNTPQSTQSASASQNSDTTNKDATTSPATTQSSTNATTKAGSSTQGNTSQGGASGGSTGGTTSGGTGSGGATGNCPLPKYPDASCTGVPAGTHLTAASDMTIRTAGTVINGMDITGCIDVEAPGVIIKNSRITCYDFLGIATNNAALSGTPLVIEDSDISCNDAQGRPGPGTAITGANFNSFRNNIHGCENGFSNDGNNDIEGNYIHDLFQGDAGHPDPHTDGLQSPDGSNSIVNHNNFDIAGNNVTSNIIYNNNPNEPITHDVTISNNLFAGGGYTVYCPRATDPNFKLLNNRFSTKYYPRVGEYGPTSDCGNETQSGNTYYETGLPLATPLG